MAVDRSVAPRSKGSKGEIDRDAAPSSTGSKGESSHRAKGDPGHYPVRGHSVTGERYNCGEKGHHTRDCLFQRASRHNLSASTSPRQMPRELGASDGPTMTRDFHGTLRHGSTQSLLPRHQDQREATPGGVVIPMWRHGDVAATSDTVGVIAIGGERPCFALLHYPKCTDTHLSDLECRPKL